MKNTKQKQKKVDYEAMMREMNFGYDDFNRLTNFVLRRHFWGDRELWDEMRDEAKIVFLNCLLRRDRNREFIPYFYGALVNVFRDMVRKYRKGGTYYDRASD